MVAIARNLPTPRPRQRGKPGIGHTGEVFSLLGVVPLHERVGRWGRSTVEPVDEPATVRPNCAQFAEAAQGDTGGDGPAGDATERILDGQRGGGINVNLTGGLPLTEAATLAENASVSFQGGRGIDEGVTATLPPLDLAIMNPPFRAPT